MDNVSTATYRRQFWEMIQDAWRSLLLNRILLVLAVLASAATVLLIGFLVYRFIQGYSGGNDATGGADLDLASPFAVLFFVVAGIPALLMCGLLWLAYAASRSARNRTLGRTGRP
jgi:hypothetical protein